MKVLVLVVVLVAGGLVLAGNAAANAGTLAPKLGTRAATDLMGLALTRHFDSWADPAARKMRCNQRIARGRVRCKFGWVQGDIAFFGVGTVWAYWEMGSASKLWGYRYRLTELDEYCFLVEHRPWQQCTHARRGFAQRA